MSAPTPDVSLREKAERLIAARAVEGGKYDRQNPAWQEFMAALDAYDDAVSDPAVIVALFDERDSLRSRVERAEAAITAYVEAKSALELSRVERDERIFTAYRALKAVWIDSDLLASQPTVRTEP